MYANLNEVIQFFIMDLFISTTGVVMCTLVVVTQPIMEWARMMAYKYCGFCHHAMTCFMCTSFYLTIVASLLLWNPAIFFPCWFLSALLSKHLGGGCILIHNGYVQNSDEWKLLEVPHSECEEAISQYVTSLDSPDKLAAAASLEDYCKENYPFLYSLLVTEDHERLHILDDKECVGVTLQGTLEFSNKYFKYKGIRVPGRFEYSEGSLYLPSSGLYGGLSAKDIVSYRPIVIRKVYRSQSNLTILVMDDIISMEIRELVEQPFINPKKKEEVLSYVYDVIHFNNLYPTCITEHVIGEEL